MSKKSSKETGIPLVIALVFFVLTTIAFGVMWYMQYSEQQAKDDAVNKAKKDVTAAQDVAADAQLEARVLRLLVGVEEEKDRESVMSETKNKEKIASKVKKYNESMAKAAGVDDPSKMPDDLKVWPVDATEPPAKGLLPVIGDAVTKRTAAVDDAAKERAAYKKAIEEIGKEIKSLQSSAKEFNEKAGAMPEDFKKKINAIATKADDRAKQFQDNEAKLRNDNVELSDKNQAVDNQLRKEKERSTGLQKQNFELNKALEKKQDTTRYEEPLGKVTRRLGEGVVEINLGAEALVRPGLTFMILPNDYPEKGRESRMMKFGQRNDKGDFKETERFVEKGSLEVIEVLGPKLSKCRITSETEPIRDSVGPGDLLYNMAWRKGVADHIALIGIFDINGDGTDDIEHVVRELIKLGIPVDAYYDLKTRTWKGQIDTQTRYIVRGAYPQTTGSTDPRAADKQKIYTTINDSIKDAQLKGGAVSIDYRDFFPRIGYRVKVDVSPDRINQAATPYLQGVTNVDAPPSP